MPSKVPAPTMLAMPVWAASTPLRCRRVGLYQWTHDADHEGKRRGSLGCKQKGERPGNEGREQRGHGDPDSLDGLGDRIENRDVHEASNHAQLQRVRIELRKIRNLRKLKSRQVRCSLRS
jgi:hypothetical protein